MLQRHLFHLGLLSIDQKRGKKARENHMQINGVILPTICMYNVLWNVTDFNDECFVCCLST